MTYTTAEFSTATRAFREIVGSDWVFVSETATDLYRDDYSPYAGTDKDIAPAAAVAPQNTVEVQRVIRVCNDYGIPFWTVSTGKNLGFGGAAPMRPWMITLDLKRMDRIIEVNEDLAFAVVEPGVSYIDLYRHIQERGLRLWMNVPSPGWGSIIANSLEHGSGYAYQGDHFQNLCGMEVVLPDGDLLRTGMGGMENPIQWHTLKYGLGAHLDGLFAQSSLGVVTRAGVWLRPEPEAFISATIKTFGADDLIPLVDTARNLRLDGVVEGTTRFSVGLTDLGIDPSFSFEGFNGISSPQEMQQMIAKVMKEKGLGAWHARMGFYGAERVVKAQWEEAKAAFSAISNASAEADFFRPPFESPKDLGVKTKLIAGVASLADWVANGSIEGHMLDSPVIPADGQTALEAHHLAARIHADFGRSFAGSEMLNRTAREILMTIGAEVYKNNIEENSKTIELFKTINTEFAKKGWGEVRAHPALMDTVQQTFSWNDHAIRRVTEKIKGALDPNNVMAPGKNGIALSDQGAQS